jgi:hypothetical protein
MADNAQFFHDTREPFHSVNPAAVTLAATNKALVPASNLPVLGSQYFARPGKKIHIRMFGQITTAVTPGNLTLGVYYGTGADANGVLLASSAAQTLIASQTNISWTLDLWIRCQTIGSTGTLWATGRAQFGTAVIAAGTFLIPASAPAVSAACDLTAALLISPQALRSGSTAETMQVMDMEFDAYN